MVEKQPTGFRIDAGSAGKPAEELRTTPPPPTTLAMSSGLLHLILSLQLLTHSSVSLSLTHTHTHTHTLFFSLSLQLAFTPPEWRDERVSVGERVRPLMHSRSLIKVSYTGRKCICVPAAAAPLRHRKWALGRRPIQLFQGFVRSQSSEVWSVNGPVTLLVRAQTPATTLRACRPSVAWKANASPWGQEQRWRTWEEPTTFHYSSVRWKVC